MGTKLHPPRILLAFAMCLRLFNRPQEAQCHLTELGHLTERYGLQTYHADYFLETARYHLSQGDRPHALEAYRRGAALVEQLGYRRRQVWVHEIACSLSE